MISSQRKQNWESNCKGKSRESGGWVFPTSVAIIDDIGEDIFPHSAIWKREA